jgi:hypothetical protein
MAEELPAGWPWPCFTLVTCKAPTGIPHGWDAELLEKGAPDGLVCRAARELTLLEHPDAGPLVCFGTMGRILRLSGPAYQTGRAHRVRGI